EVGDGFDARRDAVSRTYCYRVLTSPARSVFEHSRALWWSHRIDRDALDDCAAALVGTHDFTAFTPTETEHVHFQRRILRAEWRLGHRHAPTTIRVRADRIGAVHPDRPGRGPESGRRGRTRGLAGLRSEGSRRARRHPSRRRDPRAHLATPCAPRRPPHAPPW